jgi:NADH-quinone oxidoreductase subunit L
MLQYCWLIPVLPLIGFLINGLGRNQVGKGLAAVIGSGTVLASFVLSILIFFEIKNGNGNGYVHTMFPFINSGELNIDFAFNIDALSSLFLLIITGVGFLIHVYSSAYMHEEHSADFAKYFAYLNLFVFSMLLLVMGANYIVMFIGWEGVGLCSYLLIGYWFKNKNYGYAARKAFVMNRIGDLGFLIGIFWLIAKIGTVQYNEVFAKVSMLSATDITAITICFFIGAMGKSAQIPLYTWLPDAMAGPTPVSALIHAATMVTAGIYMIARSQALYSLAETTQTIIAIVGLATALFAATIAIKQNDIKKVLAYSTVSQLGFMFLGLGVGAYVGSIFHVMTHAFFKALLFLGAGSVIHAMHHEQDIRNMGGLNKKMKITGITFLIGCIAISGIPPFSGFFSKDEILLHTYAKSPILYGVALFAALLTAFYMFRLYFLTFTGSFRGTKHQEEHLHESPASMTLPLVVLAILSIVAGYFGLPELLTHNETGHKLSGFLAPVVKDMPMHHVTHSIEWTLIAISVTGVVISIIIAYVTTKSGNVKEATGFSKVLENKWYVDEAYDAAIVKPTLGISTFFTAIVERLGIDKLVNGVGDGTKYLGRKIRILQSGYIGNYIFWMICGLIFFLCVITNPVYRLMNPKVNNIAAPKELKKDPFFDKENKEKQTK